MIFYERPYKSGSCCVIHMKEVKNIMSAWSPCGRSGTKREEGCVFEVTHGFSQHRQINISLAFSSLQANSWASTVSPFPAAFLTWFAFDLKFAARLIRRKEKLVTLELQCSNCNRRCVLRSLLNLEEFLLTWGVSLASFFLSHDAPMMFLLLFTFIGQSKVMNSTVHDKYCNNVAQCQVLCQA